MNLKYLRIEKEGCDNHKIANAAMVTAAQIWIAMYPG